MAQERDPLARTEIQPVPVVELNDGRPMPRLGLGTWPLDDREAASVVTQAIDLGYRLIDTAARYENEHGVGTALTAATVEREELFVITKLRGADHGFEQALAGFEASRERLGLDYVDLFLIHWPLPRLDRYVDTWRALVRLRDDGLARSIGVSNFTAAQIERLIAETGAAPAVNQIELHPDFAQDEQRAWDAGHDVVTQAWSPLGRGGELLSDATVARLAREHHRTAAQIVLRWHVQAGSVPLPKSANPERLAENLAVFDFELSGDEMQALAALDRGTRLGGDPETYEEL